MSQPRTSSAGLFAFVSRHRARVAMLLLFLVASPATPDDRQLLQATSGAKTNVILILDSSGSMNNEFTDSIRLPAFMDDFVYPQGTAADTYGSKIALAKAVLRQVITKSSTSVNWAFSHYRKPNPTLGAARNAGDHLTNGGAEWLYFSDSLAGGANPCGPNISDCFATLEYPDVQQGRFLQLGHKVMVNYSADSRPPYPGAVPGSWNGAFGPHGLNEGLVVYRNPGKSGYELRMKVVSGNYSDPSIVIQVDEWGPPPTPTRTPTRTPSFTPTRTFTSTKTFTPTITPTASKTPTKTPTPTITQTFTKTLTPTITPTRTLTFTRTQTFTKTPIPSITPTPSRTPTITQTPTPISGQMPASSVLPAAAGWFSPVVRGILAMVPPPPPTVGFDDPQANPTAGLTLLKSVQIQYTRGDLYNIPTGFSGGPQGTYAFTVSDTLTGNPPWGSQTAPVNDGDADGTGDLIANRYNQGMYVADDDAASDSPCAGDTGGFAKFADLPPTGFTPYPAAALPAPPRPDLWPVVPFQRDWKPDTPNVPVLKKLLRFVSSIVSYNSAMPTLTAYTLEESMNDTVVATANTPIAGALKDVYQYLKLSVFPDTSDPDINCRNYMVVFVTDGLETCGGNACSGAGFEAGNANSGISKDLGLMALPESAPGMRALAAAKNTSIRLKGVPVHMVTMGLDPTDPSFTCIANNSGGSVKGATDRAGLQAAIESILELKPQASVIAAPSLPAFASGSGDVAHFGAAIPSHINEDTSRSRWSIWAGSLKAFNLDANGQIPVITVGTDKFPDETAPNAAATVNRRPAWNAARVLGYTDPVANLAPGALPITSLLPSAATKAPGLKVWPGRKMLWATASGTNVPMTRLDFLPDDCATFPCSPLITQMGLNPASATDKAKAKLVAQFLRGGKTAYGNRDEILNDPTVKPATLVPFVIGPGVGQNQQYSYYFQDDTPPPGLAPQVRTDAGTPPAVPNGYPHKLGDIFHSEAAVVDPPRFFPYLSLNLPGYGAFVDKYAKRRRVILVGSNDGFLHAFDTGVWNRDTVNYNNAFDLGTGREMFAFAPPDIISGFPNVLAFPPPAKPAYFMDGSMGVADAFLDTAHGGVPVPANRKWRTVVVGGLRQGGAAYYALDVTQPDDIDAAGLIIGNNDAAPGCLNGGPASCSGKKYPEVLWTLTDTNIPKMGETWSRPVLGRIKIINGVGFEDRYVAIFGGGSDPNYTIGTPIVTSGATATRGRSIYIVDLETGQILHKASVGVDGTGLAVNLAPVPSAVAAADYSDDGYLDIAYVGDVNGRMWRFDLTPDTTASPKRGELIAGKLQGYKPYLLYDGSVNTTKPFQPIFFEPGIVFLSGGTPPTLGVAFGTGDRSNLIAPNPVGNNNEFLFVIDAGQTNVTYDVSVLRNITPGVGTPGTSSTGYFLDYQSTNEKTTSSVFSTRGYLSLVTFTPDAGNNPCTTDGKSFRYRFFFQNGGPGYPTQAPGWAQYQQSAGAGLASAVQSTSPIGDTIDSLFFAGGALDQQTTGGTVNRINKNWKELQP